jgi:hypothetical protein
MHEQYVPSGQWQKCQYVPVGQTPEQFVLSKQH